MESGVHSDYVSSLSLMSGIDMGMNFEGFGENMKFMELPIKYLDSVHDQAVGLVEDIHAFIHSPVPDDELPKKAHEVLNNPSSSNVIIGSSPIFAQTELVDPTEESSSSPTSFSTADDSSLGSFDTNIHETESVLPKLPDRCTSGDTVALERTVGTKQEVILRNSDNLSDRCIPEDPVSLRRTGSVEEDIIFWNPGSSVKQLQPPEPTTIVQDYVYHELSTDKVKEQVGLHSSAHSGLSGGTISHDLNADLFNDADDITDFVDIDLRDDQEWVENNKAVGPSVHQPKNTSFKKIFMRSLSNKLGWSKKDRHVDQAVPIRSPEVVNVCYQANSSSDDLEDDWELL